MRYCMLLSILMINHYNVMNSSCKGKESKICSQQIVFLNGTTTAGKTDAAIQLEGLLLSHSVPVKILSIDKFVIPKAVERFLTERINLRNIFVANENLFQKSHIKQIKEESMVELCAAAISLYKQNNVVIIDAPIYKAKHIQFYTEMFNEFDISNVRWVLLYCPVTTLVQRVIDRNQKSPILEQRSIAQALHQFSKFYQSKDNDSIDQLSRKDFDDICAQAEKKHYSMQETIPSPLKGIQKVICPFEFNEVKNKVLEKLLFDADDMASISPTINYNYRINTALSDPMKCAKMICDFLIKEK